MAKTNLASMSVDALLKLREDIGNVLSRKADQLKDQLSRLGHEIGSRKRIGRSSLNGRKVAIKYRDKSGNTWAGRGAQPIWLREKLKAGAKHEDFAVQKSMASRTTSPRSTTSPATSSSRSRQAAGSTSSTRRGPSTRPCPCRRGHSSPVYSADGTTMP